MIFGIFTGICFVVFILFVKHYKTRRQNPPGPLGFPFLGIVPFRFLQFLLPKLTNKVSDKIYFKQMKDKYGDVWSFELGAQRMIVLSSIEAVNETFVDKGNLLTRRASMESFKVISENYGFMFTSGRLWIDSSKLAIKALHDLGMGTRNLKDDICDEAHDFIEYIEKNLSIPFISPDIFAKPTSNVISKLVFNERNNYDDPELKDYLKNLKQVFSSYIAQTIIDLLPRLHKSKIIRICFPMIEKLVDSNKACLSFISNKCRSRIKVESEYLKPSCVFDYFWRYRFQDQPDIIYNEKFMEISHSMYDLYNGGMDTTINTLGFSLLFLGQQQNIQNDLRTEIHSLTDDYKSITMEMKMDCPKLLSFLDEVQRVCYLVPMIYHKSWESFMFRGYEIKTDDIILVDLYTVSRDPLHFENPDIFDPYRFLDETKTKYIPSKYFIPFGTGRRTCPGQNIAVIEMFLFLSKIIHRFDISLTKESQDNRRDIFEGIFGIVHAPLEHEIIFSHHNYHDTK